MELIISNIFGKCSFIINLLLKQSIYTLILFIIIFILTFLLKKKSPLWHYGLWLLILIRLLLPTDLSFSVSARNLFDHFPIINNVTAPIETIIGKRDNIQIQSLEEASNNTLPKKENYLTSAESLNFTKDKLLSWPILFTFVWIIGCLLMILVVLKKLWRFHCIIKNSSFIQNDKLTAFLMNWQHRLKIGRTVRIVSSDEFLSPFTVGLLNPKIYIPNTLFNSADLDTIHSIIAHELVHIKYYDALWIKLQNILQIIFFFNPVVWYANRQISVARELICDSTVVTEGIISPKTYGNSILQVLKYNLFGLDLAELLPCFGSHKKIYKERFQNIIKENAMKKQKTVFILLAICLIGFFLLPLAGSYTNAAQNEKKANDKKINLIIPLKGHVSELFGSRKSPVTGKEVFHEGMDITAEKGTPILAAASGKVVKAEYVAKYGYRVTLQHNDGYSTIYAHCDKILVKEGQSVKSGDTIATCGETGSDTGPHLYFELRKDGKTINPYPYLRKNDKVILNEKKTNNDEINFIIPLDANLGHISSLFGWRNSPFGFGRDFHSGIDIAAPEGTPIIASASGVVTKAGWGGGYGNLIILQHTNGYSTAYAKCKTMLVKEGQSVKSGDTIATCGQTGAATGPHLHFEIRKDGYAIDPYKYVSSIPILPKATENKFN
jgi:murein DD-endopeptidase MepM/ murein hydrolase activator NlpD